MKYKLLTMTAGDPDLVTIINEMEPHFNNPRFLGHQVFDNFWHAWAVQQQIAKGLLPVSARLKGKE